MLRRLIEFAALRVLKVSEAQAMMCTSTASIVSGQVV